MRSIRVMRIHRIILLLLLLAVAGSAVGQQKTIEDPAEYTAYFTAANTADANARAAAIENFLKTYPSSIARPILLENLMNTYKELRNDAMVQDTASRLLEANPDQLTALAVLAYKGYLEGQRTYNQQVLAQAADYGQRGLRSLQLPAYVPDGVLPEDWLKARMTFRKVFENAIGMNAFVARDYKTAQSALSAVVAAQPNDLPSVFLLAEAELEQEPFAPDGLFWGARAIALSRAKPSSAGGEQIQKYVRAKYIQKNGSDSGFEEMITAAGGDGTVPPGFKLAEPEKVPEPPADKPIEKPLELSTSALGEKEITDLLKSSVSSQRVSALVVKFGVSFTMTAAIEARLRNAGASDKLIRDIASHKK